MSNLKLSEQAGPLPLDRVEIPRRPRRGAQGLLAALDRSSLVPLTVDAIMLLAGMAAALAASAAAGLSLDGAWMLAAFPPLVLAQLGLRASYRPHLRRPVLDGLRIVLTAISLVTIVLIAAEALFLEGAPLSSVLVRVWLFSVATVGIGRVGMCAVRHWARSSGAVAVPAVIVGAGTVGNHVARRLLSQPEYGLEPIGFLDPDPLAMEDERAVPVLGGFEDLEYVIGETGAGHVILAFSSMPDSMLLPLTAACRRRHIPVSLVPRLFDSMSERFVLQHVGGIPLLSLYSVDPKGWQFAVKHAMDRIVALLVLMLLLPLLLLVAAAVKLTSPGPALFRQRRVGRDGQEFDLLKFRSMRTPSEPLPFDLDSDIAPGGVEGDDRRTAVGRLIRRFSADELPQLINVLRGEMSLIGPRPERPEYVELFRRGVNRYTERHRVRSGITGWAQVHGLRGQTSLADRIEWDNFYIENWSLWLDFKIILMTVVEVWRGE